CGWANERSDQLLLNRGASTVRLFDERQQYQNANYDVSFFVGRAKVSRNHRVVPMTVQGSQKATYEIGGSEEGQDIPSQLERIKKILPELPTVHVVPAGGGKTVTSLPKAAFIGWLNDGELLIVENGVLVAFNVATQMRRKSTIKAEKEAYVFLR